jgi:hypothetical protein
MAHQPDVAFGAWQPAGKESEMKRFMLLHVGFEQPSAEIMAAWGRWFDSIADHSVENGGFHRGGKEISASGTRDLPLAPDSITGYSIIRAESLEDAEKLASRNPFISSIRVYEITGG